MIHSNLIAEKVPGQYTLQVTDEFGTDLHSVSTLGPEITFQVVKGDEVFNKFSNVIIKIVLNELLQIGVNHQSDTFIKIWQVFRKHYQQGVATEFVTFHH